MCHLILTHLGQNLQSRYQGELQSKRHLTRLQTAPVCAGGPGVMKPAELQHQQKSTDAIMWPPKWMQFTLKASVHWNATRIGRKKLTWQSPAATEKTVAFTKSMDTRLPLVIQGAVRHGWQPQQPVVPRALSTKNNHKPTLRPRGPCRLEEQSARKPFT